MSDRINPTTRWAAVTPSDSANLQPACRALYSHDGGNVAAVGTDGVAGTFLFAAGEIKPIAAVRVNSTNTTSTTILALY